MHKHVFFSNLLTLNFHKNFGKEMEAKKKQFEHHNHLLAFIGEQTT